MFIFVAHGHLLSPMGSASHTSHQFANHIMALLRTVRALKRDSIKQQRDRADGVTQSEKRWNNLYPKTGSLRKKLNPAEWLAVCKVMEKITSVESPQAKNKPSPHRLTRVPPAWDLTSSGTPTPKPDKPPPQPTTTPPPAAKTPTLELTDFPAIFAPPGMEAAASDAPPQIRGRKRKRKRGATAAEAPAVPEGGEEKAPEAAAPPGDSLAHTLTNDRGQTQASWAPSRRSNAVGPGVFSCPPFAVALAGR